MGNTEEIPSSLENAKYIFIFTKVHWHCQIKFAGKYLIFKSPYYLWATAKLAEFEEYLSKKEDEEFILAAQQKIFNFPLPCTSIGNTNPQICKKQNS